MNNEEKKINMEHAFNYIQSLSYFEYCKNGFKEFFEKLNFDNYRSGDLLECLLMHTEIDECAEMIRKDNPEYYLEFADIIIRVFNYCNRKNINLYKFIMEKINMNKSRKFKHGNEVI